MRKESKVFEKIMLWGIIVIIGVVSTLILTGAFDY